MPVVEMQRLTGMLETNEDVVTEVVVVHDHRIEKAVRDLDREAEGSPRPAAAPRRRATYEFD